MRTATVVLAASVFAATFAATPAAAEPLYKCDAGGAVTIQSEPCPKGATQIWVRDVTPEPGPTPEDIAARAALAQAEAQRLAEQARLAQQSRIDDLVRRDDELRARAAEAAGRVPERKSDCTLAHEFADAAYAKDWLNLSETQRDRLRRWVVEQCKDPLGREEVPATAPSSSDPVTL
jgi:hypothetical protein